MENESLDFIDFVSKNDVFIDIMPIFPLVAKCNKVVFCSTNVAKDMGHP